MYTLLPAFLGLFLINYGTTEGRTAHRGAPEIDDLKGDEDWRIKDPIVGQAWLDELNKQLETFLYASAVAKWNYETNITSENERLMVEAQHKLSSKAYGYLKQLDNFDWQKYDDPTLQRRFRFYWKKNSRKLELTNEVRKTYRMVTNSMRRIYSTGKVCRNSANATHQCYSVKPGLERLFADNRDWDTLLWAWKAWRDESGKPMKDLYSQYVAILINGTIKQGKDDIGALWRGQYEVDNFEPEVNRLWEEVKPLYLQLHTYVRRKLQGLYKDHPFPSTGHMPAHILGNIWGHLWGVKEVTLPYPDEPKVDLDSALKQKNYTVRDLYRLSDSFFQSLGLHPMPEVFWEKSMFTRPEDGRHVVCHPSAWDLHNRKDFRIKACTSVTYSDLQMIHHEMGHIQYFMEYAHLPYEFRLGANPGFHEAVGDLIALSVSTPEHLKLIGLLNEIGNNTRADLNFLMTQALGRVAFLPYGFLVDQWRWKVFRQEVSPHEYSATWWKMKCKYQGLYPPTPRTNDDFDPGAAYHISAGVPYIRYFVSFILQFQFHQALCQKAGHTGPLHRCDIYNSKEAGKALRDMLSLGSSKPWPEVLKQLTGSERMDAKALLDYFKPLHEWLVKQNEGERVGFDEDCPPGSVLDKENLKADPDLFRILPDHHQGTRRETNN